MKFVNVSFIIKSVLLLAVGDQLIRGLHLIIIRFARQLFHFVRPVFCNRTWEFENLVRVITPRMT